MIHTQSSGISGPNLPLSHLHSMVEDNQSQLAWYIPLNKGVSLENTPISILLLKLLYHRTYSMKNVTDNANITLHEKSNSVGFATQLTSSAPSTHLGGKRFVTPIAASGSKLIPDTSAMRSSASCRRYEKTAN